MNTTTATTAPIFSSQADKNTELARLDHYIAKGGDWAKLAAPLRRKLSGIVVGA